MPHRLTLTKMAELIRQRKLSPVELVDAHLDQIEKHNPAINAFVMQFPSEARAAARQAEREPCDGPLHGVPVTIKDSFDIRDLPTLCGSRFRLAHRAPADATVVTRIRQAGGIILGKTNCPEFLANWESDNYITGRTNNPWDIGANSGRIERRRVGCDRSLFFGRRSRQRWRRIDSCPRAFHRDLRIEADSRACALPPVIFLKSRIRADYWA